MGDGAVLRIDLNLSGHSVQAPEWHGGSILFETLPNAAELSRNGVLNPYTAIVSLIATDVMEDQDEQ
jgi:maltooligosyltrehalose trehalohydrolase